MVWMSILHCLVHLRGEFQIYSFPSFWRVGCGALGQPCPMKRKKCLETIWILVETFAAYWFTRLLAPSVVHAHHPPTLTCPQWAVVLQRSLPPQQPSRVLRMLGYWNDKWSENATCWLTQILFNSMEGSGWASGHVFFECHAVSYVDYLISKLLLGQAAWMLRTPSLQTPPLRPRTPRPQRPPPTRRRHKQKQPQSKQRKASCPGRGMGPEISRGEFVIK